MKVKIIADSTCDLSTELLKKYDVLVTPLSIEKDGKYYKDTLEIKPEDIFAHVERTGKLCRTAAVNIAEYEEVYAEVLKSYDGIIQLTISSDMSSCYQNAMLAAEKFENVYVIDSRNLSTGIGQLVVEAGIRAQAGMDAKQIFEEVDAMKSHLNVSFIIEKLDYLAKGGRCSTLAAISAGLLGIKPCIEVVDGKMGVGKKYRGSIISVVKSYVKDRLEGHTDLDLHRIFITYPAKTGENVADAVEQAVRECAPFEEILRTNAGCTISNHCGPSCIGILYFTK